jgi:hypothetical protein
MSTGLLPSQIAKVKKLVAHDYCLRDILQVTGYGRADVQRVLGVETALSLDELENRKMLKRLRSARPKSRSVEEHEKILRANFPEVYEG